MDQKYDFIMPHVSSSRGNAAHPRLAKERCGKESRQTNSYAVAG
jgi:hypothetical protein